MFCHTVTATGNVLWQSLSKLCTHLMKSEIHSFSCPVIKITCHCTDEDLQGDLDILASQLIQTLYL